MSEPVELVAAVRTVTLPRPDANALTAAIEAASGLVELRLGSPFDDDRAARHAVELLAATGTEKERAVLSMARGTAHFDLVRTRAALAGSAVSLALDPRDLLLGYAMPFAGVDEVLEGLRPLLPTVRVFHYGFATSEHGDVPVEVFSRVPRGLADVHARIGRAMCERLFDETARARHRRAAPLTVVFDAARAPRFATAIRARHDAAVR